MFLKKERPCGEDNQFFIEKLQRILLTVIGESRAGEPAPVVFGSLEPEPLEKNRRRIGERINLYY